MTLKFDLNSPDSSLMQAMDLFFKNRSFDHTQTFFFKLFQCWGVKECDQFVDLTNEDVALFFDQLLNLVGVSYIAYQANKAVISNNERGSYE
jgi:hypothetical protein